MLITRYFSVTLREAPIAVDDLDVMIARCTLEAEEVRHQRRLNAGIIDEPHTRTLSPWLIRNRYDFL